MKGLRLGRFVHQNKAAFVLFIELKLECEFVYYRAEKFLRMTVDWAKY